MDVGPSDTSSEDSYFEQEPISGAVLLDQELLRREECEARGNILTGCQGLDDYVLLGGLSRGGVVGLSAEEETFGLLLALQTIAKLLVSGHEAPNASRCPTATIITTLSHADLLPRLRSVVRGQVDALPSASNAGARVKDVLGRISISRVFDFDGLREALDELDRPAEAGPVEAQAQVPAEQPDDVLEVARLLPGHEPQPEIRDSQDEDEASSPCSPSSLQQVNVPNMPQEQKSKQPPSPSPVQPHPHSPVPDLVLITNLTALITSLYTTRDRRHAHRMLRHLSSRLRYLSRSPSHGAPLFVLLNTTTSRPPSSNPPQGLQQDQPPSSPTQSSPSPSPPRSPSARPPPLRDQRATNHGARNREAQEDISAMHSVFNPPAPDPAEERGEVDQYGYARHPNLRFGLLARLARRNKPFFGARFAGLVDVHLLATRVPRTDADAEVFFAALGGDGTGVEGVGDGAGLVWVVEVLGDGIGVWVEDFEGEEGEELAVGGGGEGREERRIGRRFNREQRWAGVEVREARGGVRVVDALGFEGMRVSGT